MPWINFPLRHILIVITAGTADVILLPRGRIQNVFCMPLWNPRASPLSKTAEGHKFSSTPSKSCPPLSSSKAVQKLTFKSFFWVEFTHSILCHRSSSTSSVGLLLAALLVVLNVMSLRWTSDVVLQSVRFEISLKQMAGCKTEKLHFTPCYNKAKICMRAIYFLNSFAFWHPVCM